MKKILIILIMSIFFVSGCSSNEDRQENKIEDQKYMVQVTSQTALKNYNIYTHTSPSLDDWIINNQTYGNTLRWTAVTYDDLNKKVKCIFEWNGKDEDDLILVYLFYNNKEIVNDL